MSQAPLLSAEVFDYLRQLGVEPYTKLDDPVRTQLGDGVRLVALFAGEHFSTPRGRQRISVLSGRIRLDPSSIELDLESTRNHSHLTPEGGGQLHAVEDATLLLADAGFLDTLSSWAELAAYARQAGGEELASRLAAVRHTTAFQQLPIEHVIQALQKMSPRKVKAGETIVKQGERGDAYFLIWSGRAEVWRAGIYDEEQKRVAEIGRGEGFGDEALVTGSTRNATVKMAEDGLLLVLGDEAFRELMSRPLIEEVWPNDVPALLNEGWKVLDVRYEEEFEDGHIPGALNLPLPELRARADSLLDKNAPYISVCLSGKRSTVAAYLLKQRGYRVRTMKDGMSGWAGETSS